VPGVRNPVHPVQGLKFHTELVGKKFDLAFHIRRAQGDMMQAFNFVTHVVLRWICWR
jgi:hypothetical protein